MANQPKTFAISGLITNQQGYPIEGLIIRAFDQDPNTPDNPLGQPGITDVDGKYNISYTEEDFKIGGKESGGPDVFVRVYDEDELIEQSPVKRNAGKSTSIDLQVDYEIQTEQYIVKGGVYTSKRIEVPNMKVQLMEKGVEGDKLLSSAETDHNGQFKLEFDYQFVGKKKPDLQVVAIDFKDPKKILGRSELRYDATREEKIDLILPSANDPVLPNEFQELKDALFKHTKKVAFKDLQENEEKSDISFLAGKTGIDARLIGMTALAHEYGEKNDLPAEVYYALFRAGQPTDESGISRIHSGTIKNVLKQAIKSNVISKEHEAKIPEYVQKFEKAAVEFTLQHKGSAGLSTMDEFLGLTLDKKEDKTAFAKLYRENQDKLDQFWEKTSAKFGETRTKRLRLDGKLGFMTLNNGPLVQKLWANQQIDQDPVELVRNGFYKTEKWEELLTIDIPIPNSIEGEDRSVKRKNYAAMMTAQLRLSYPTVVLAQQIEHDEFLLTNDRQVKNAVTRFLETRQGDFEIGKTPVKRYLKDKNIELDPDPDRHAATLKELKRLERVYQITPSDQAIQVLLKNNLDSAFTIANKFDEDTFARKFAMEMGGENIARLTYAKSNMVAGAVMNIALAYGSYRRNPSVYSINAGHFLHNDMPGADDVIINPTLEELFGEMDFCECEHCRSVLSPAAYFVDLLKFIDRTENLGGKENPYEVLRSRRPDLEYIGLTCENTNTVLPYIDLVNEILEYFVVNGNLTNFQGYNVEENEESADLLASPQYVMDQAYQILQTQVYPMKLPFNYFLETSRAYFNHMKLPLWKAMKYFRTGNALSSPGAAPLAPYGWKEIYTEYLGVTPQSYSILTSNDSPLALHYGENAGADLNAFFMAENEYSKKLTRKLGISYKELVAIVKTQFFNPHAHLIKKLEKLEAGLPTIIRHIDSNGADSFELPAEIDQSKYDDDVKAWLLKQGPSRNIDNPAHIKSLIFLTDPTGNTDDCNFVPLQLRYADGSELRPIEYWKLLRFVRLWKTLDWTIEQTDLALSSLYDKAQIPAPGDSNAVAINKLNQGFEVFLIRLGQAKEVMYMLNMDVRRDLGRIMAFWSSIDTYDSSSLYRQLFLSPAIRKIDNVFEEDSYGQFLQDNTQTLAGHLPAILAALNLKEDSYQLLHSTLGLSDELTLDNLSQLYRHAFLSRALSLSIEEFLIIRNLMGINDLFSDVEAVPNPTIQFIETVRILKDAGLKIPNINYLLTHQDISGKASPSQHDILSFAKSIRTELLAIESENQEGQEDPNGDIARAKLAQTYGQSIADEFFGLIERTSVFVASYDHNTEDLESSAKAVSSRLKYDPVNKRLSFDGSMTETEKIAYLEIGGTSQAFKDAIVALYTAQSPSETDYTHGSANLNTNILSVSSYLSYNDFAKQLSFQGVMTAQEQENFKQLGLQPAFIFAIDELFAQSQSLLEQLPDLGDLYQAHFETKSIFARRASYNQILDWVLPVLKPKLKNNALRELVGSALSTDSQMLVTLMETPEVIHSDENSLKPLITDFYAIESGINFSTDVPAAGQLRLRAYIDPPATDFFNLYIQTDAANAAVQINNNNIPGTFADGVWTNDAAIALKAAKLNLLEIVLTGTGNEPITKWATQTIGKETITGEYLYAFEEVEIFKAAYIRLLKSIALLEALSFSTEETRYFSQFTIDDGGNPKKVNWLNGILCPTQNTAASIQDVFSHFMMLLTYDQLKRRTKIKGEDLISVLSDPQIVNEDGENLLLKITNWSLEDRDVLLQRFGWNISELSNPIRLNKLWEAFEMSTQTGLSASLLSKVVTVSPTLDIITELQAGLRIRYDIASWREVIQPINDRLRIQQRDALVSYVLHQLSRNAATAHLNTSEKLFEYLLIDVEMDSCMKTSRIKQAISTVQLFIHRCFLNLEKNVSPGALNAEQWNWTSRYRVWEANRKVFLWPENWIEPELRDRKSSFFKELEGELLQSEITEETAATALLNYLEKLENVSKLEICGMYIQENQIEKDGTFYTADDIVHVFGMTPGTNRNYYYRRFEYGYWTPWEKVDLDIEDLPILPVLWKDRLFLFWLILKPQGIGTKATINKGEDSDRLIDLEIDTSSFESEIKPMAFLSWSEYYDGKWQTRRTSDDKILFSISEENLEDFSRENIRFKASEGIDGELIINIESNTFSLFKKNSLPEVGGETIFSIVFNSRKFFQGNQALLGSDGVNFPTISISYSNYLENFKHHDLIKGTPELVFQSTQGNLKNSWIIPFFIQNNQHVFYVSPEVSYCTISTFNDFGVFVAQPGLIDPIIPKVWVKPKVAVQINPIDPIFRAQPIGPLKPIPDPREILFVDRLREGKVGQAVLFEQALEFRGVKLGTKGILLNSSPDF